MKTLSLPARLMRAAMHFQAKGDVRYYLNGIHFDPAGFINATNGHILFRAECEEAKELDAPLILGIQGKIPAKAITANLTISDDNQTGSMWFQDAHGKPIMKLGLKDGRFFEVIDGKFPDVDRVLPKGDPVPTESFGVNSSYMAIVAEAAKAIGISYPIVKVNLRGENEPLEINLKGPELDATVIIMPART